MNKHHLYQKPQVVVWDWNGTLLDDVRYAINVRNVVFPRFGLPVIEDIETYHEQFTFPVRLYYERAGVTEENFVAVANAWMDEYVANCHAVPLFGDALLTLDRFEQAGLVQVVLSASKEDHLRNQLQSAGILERFQGVLGLSHIYATDKTDIARSWFKETGIDPAACIMLGDTAHDAYVADRLHMRCILVARGHMSKIRLLETGHPVCESLVEAADQILGRKTETV